MSLTVEKKSKVLELRKVVLEFRKKKTTQKAGNG